MNAAAKKIIAELGLQPLPHEGGFFCQSWISVAQLPNGRCASSAIWFLLTPDSFSALHRIRSEELWHFYAGDPVEHVQLLRPIRVRGPVRGRIAAAAHVTVLGADVLEGQSPQLVVPGGVWQGARLRAGPRAQGWALLGCTVTPAWVDEEFELGARAALLRDFPRDAGWVGVLTR